MIRTGRVIAATLGLVLLFISAGVQANTGYSASFALDLRILPGDGDGDGVVSIGEVQKAINMFLGSQAVGNGADCNGDGVVSIGEVQKVINAFLGVSTSC